MNVIGPLRSLIAESYFPCKHFTYKPQWQSARTCDLLLIGLHLRALDVPRDDLLQVGLGRFARVRVHQQSSEQLEQILRWRRRTMKRGERVVIVELWTGGGIRRCKDGRVWGFE